MSMTQFSVKKVSSEYYAYLCPCSHVYYLDAKHDYAQHTCISVLQFTDLQKGGAGQDCTLEYWYSNSIFGTFLSIK